MYSRFFKFVPIILAIFGFARAPTGLLVTVFAFLTSAIGLSESIRSGNSREVCRKTISSTLGSLVAESARAEDAVQLSETYKKKSRQRVAEEEVKMRAVNKKLEGTDYTPETMAQQNQISTNIKLFHTQMLESDQQLELAKKQQSTANNQLAKLRKKVDLIFTVTMNDDPDGGPRRIFNTIEWRSLCPKYRVLCPLPAADILTLIGITDEIDDIDQGCNHYSKLK